MTRTTIFTAPLLMAALLGLTCGLAHAADRLQPGLWLSTVTVNGRPTGPQEPRCITAEDAKTANGSDAEVSRAIDAENRKNGCSTADLVIDGPRIAFSTVCTGMTMRMDLTYEGTRSNGTMTMQSPGAPRRIMQVANARTGDCK